MVSQECPPSVCMFTALNAHGGVTCCDVSDDTSLLALGYVFNNYFAYSQLFSYGDAQINLFALDETQKLRRLRDSSQLEDVSIFYYGTNIFFRLILKWITLQTCYMTRLLRHRLLC